MSGHDEQDGVSVYSTRSRPGLSTQATRKARAAALEHTSDRMALARIDAERRRLAVEEQWILSKPTEPLPTDEDPDGPVVFFRKRFDGRTGRYAHDIGGGRDWQYVAVRTGSGRWYLTGKQAPRDPMRWSDLVDFIASEETAVPIIWRATEWSAINSEQGLPD